MIKFTPLISGKIDSFIRERKELKKITRMFSSPCNIIFPELLDENITNFKKVFSHHQLRGKIFYAHKTNKSSAIVKQALFNNICIDVASYNELKNVLGSGFNGQSIEATGPKNDDFIILGIQQNIIFNIDNLEELDRIIYLSKKINKDKVRVLIRLSGFISEETIIVNKQSRFGTDVSDIDTIFNILENNLDKIDFLGFSFHLDTVSIKEKVIAIEECIKLLDKAFERGFSPRVLDIGGGFKVNYLKDENEWNNSISVLKNSFVNSRESLTWNNNMFGLSLKDGVLKGILNIYEYFDKETGPKYLDEILSTKLDYFQHRTIGQILSENMIDLYIEPGKALVDQLGITISTVNFVKQKGNDTLIGLDLKRSDLVIADQELFIDPIVISNNSKLDKEQGVYFIGNLCLESDLIFKHKVFLDVIPKHGDIIIFVNTAGYFMDFNASDTIKQKIASKVVVTEHNGVYSWYLDDVYNPIIDKELRNDI